MTNKKAAWAKCAGKKLRKRMQDDLTWQMPVSIAVQPVCAARESRTVFDKIISGHDALPLMAE